MKGIAAVFISILLILESCFIPPLYTNDDEQSSPQTVSQPDEKDTYIKDDYIIPEDVGREKYQLLDESSRICYSLINDACKAMDEQAFPVPKDMDMDKMEQAFDAYVKDYPESFWLYRSFSRLEKGSKVYMQLSYCTDRSETEEMRNALDDIASEIADKAKQCSDDFETEVVLHDFITSFCEYDYESAENGYENHELSYTAYGALVEGKAVCEGYARAMQLLCRMCGIECTVVSGIAGEDRISHMWNIITIDGQKYHLDVTWDDNDDFAALSANGSESDAPEMQIDNSGDDNFIDLTQQDDSESEEMIEFDEKADGSQYMYFNLPDKLIANDHFEFDSEECISTEANYYEHSGTLFRIWSSDNRDIITQIIANKADEGEHYVTVAFLTEEDYNIAMEYLIENSGIFDILKKVNRISENKVNFEQLNYKTRYGPLYLLTLELEYK